MFSPPSPGQVYQALCSWW